MNLAAFYPHPEANLPIWKVAAAAAVLAGISAAAFISWRRYPYLLMGWLWYGVTLLPVIGLMQVGGQAMADRFTYVTQIGLYLALVWGAADVCRCWPYLRWLCGLTPVLLLVASMACAWRQTSFWRDSETLWNHTLACTSRNTVAHNILACAFASRGQFDAAILQFRRALEIKPDYAPAHQNLGNTLNRLSRFDEALSHFRAAARLQPDSAQLRAGIGTVLARLGRCDEALAEYTKALEIEPGFAMGHNNLGNILLDMGRQDEALAHYRQAAKFDPNFAMAHYNLAKLLVDRGDFDEALWHYQQLVRIDPNSSLAHDGLGAALSRMSRFGESLARYRQLLEVNPRDTAARCNMGAAWAECGQFEKALACYRRAVELQPDSVPAQVKLAWLRATCPLASLRDGREAIEHALQASQLCQDAQTQVLETLAAAYAEAGWFPEAVATANKAVELAERQHDRASAERLARNWRYSRPASRFIKNRPLPCRGDHTKPTGQLRYALGRSIFCVSLALLKRSGPAKRATIAERHTGRSLQRFGRWLPTLVMSRCEPPPSVVVFAATGGLLRSLALFGRMVAMSAPGGHGSMPQSCRRSSRRGPDQDMLAKLKTFSLLGIDALPVEVEVDVSPAGLPKTVLVGLPEAAVKESTHRVARAIANSGFQRPQNRVVINLAPAGGRRRACWKSSASHPWGRTALAPPAANLTVPVAPAYAGNI